MKKSKTLFLLLLVLPIILAILTLTACDENVDPRTFEITMEAQQVVNTNNIQVTWEPRADIDEVRITDYYNNTEQSSVIIKNAQLTKGMHTIDSNFGKNHTIIYLQKEWTQKKPPAVILAVPVSTKLSKLMKISKK